MEESNELAKITQNILDLADGEILAAIGFCEIMKDALIKKGYHQI